MAVCCTIAIKLTVLLPASPLHFRTLLLRFGTCRTHYVRDKDLPAVSAPTSYCMCVCTAVSEQCEFLNHTCVCLCRNIKVQGHRVTGSQIYTMFLPIDGIYDAIADALTLPSTFSRITLQRGALWEMRGPWQQKNCVGCPKCIWLLWNWSVHMFVIISCL